MVNNLLKSNQMKKNYLLHIILVLFCNIYSYGQFGVGTNTPQGIFHVDAKQNTVVTSTPSNFEDDVVVSTSGDVGIGTLTPSTKLEIHSAIPGAIKIVDGTQGVNKVLVSDNNGIGTWQDLPVFKYMVNGNFTPNQNIFSSDPAITSVKNSFATITLNKGRWLISSGLTIGLGVSDATTNVIPYWLNLYLSSSTTNIENTTFSYIGNNIKNSFGGNMIQSQGNFDNFNLIKGTTIIDVPNDNTTIYILIQNINKDSSGGNVKWQYNSSNYENYLYAIPTN